MTRNKVNLAYISNDAARKITFKKRKKGLAKKVSELTTLCGIEACAIIFSPYDSQPEVWPDPKGARQVIARYKNSPIMDERKNFNLESFMGQRITKASSQLKKQRKENHEKEMTLAMFECFEGERLDNMTMVDLDDIDCLIEKNIKEINKKLDELI